MRLLLVIALAIPLGLDLYMPVPEENLLTADKIELGRRLFNDRRLSRDGTIACASCHDPGRAFSDGRALASSRVNLGTQTIAYALASYVRNMLSGDSPYDRFINGDRTALSAEQQAGLQIFRGKANCTACHVGPTFSDERLHNTGVAWRSSGFTPVAQRFSAALAGLKACATPGCETAVSGDFADPGAGRGDFKMPTLREVARTAPYMHDGSLATLEAVVDFYDEGGHANPGIDPEIPPVHLTADEKRALVAFLRSLSGTIREGAAVLGGP